MATFAKMEAVASTEFKLTPVTAPLSTPVGIVVKTLTNVPWGLMCAKTAPLVTIPKAATPVFALMATKAIIAK